MFLRRLTTVRCRSLPSGLRLPTSIFLSFPSADKESDIAVIWRPERINCPFRFGYWLRRVTGQRRESRISPLPSASVKAPSQPFDHQEIIDCLPFNQIASERKIDSALAVWAAAAGLRNQKASQNSRTAAASANTTQVSNFLRKRRGTGITTRVAIRFPLSISFRWPGRRRFASVLPDLWPNISLSTRSSDGGVSGDRLSIAGGSVVMIAATTFAVDLPSKARRPVAIS